VCWLAADWCLRVRNPNVSWHLVQLLRAESCTHLSSGIGTNDAVAYAEVDIAAGPHGETGRAAAGNGWEKR